MFSSTSTTEFYRFLTFSSSAMFKCIFVIIYKSSFQREITKKLGNPKQPTNPFLEMIKFLLERIAPVHIDTESIRYLSLQISRFLSHAFNRLVPVTKPGAYQYLNVQSSVHYTCGYNLCSFMFRWVAFLASHFAFTLLLYFRELKRLSLGGTILS